MKTFITLLLALWLPLSAFAATGSGNVSSVLGLGVAGPAVTAVSNPASTIQIPTSKAVFSIVGGDVQAAATNTNYYPFYKNGVAFQAGSSGTFCFNFRMSGGTANTGVQLVSATAAFAYNANSLTGAVYQGGASGKTTMMVSGTVNALSWMFQPGVYTFGANTYGGYQAENSQGFVVGADCYDL